MKRMAVLFVAVFCFSSISFSQSSGPKLSGQWFSMYKNGDSKGETINEFSVTRGYVTIKNNYSETLSGRFTTDVAMDKEGDGFGDMEIRLKYCYLKKDLDDFSLFTNPYVEAGLIHRAFIDFEQKINQYRVQGSMFLDRNKLSSSADFGVMGVAMLGGVMDEEYQKNVSKSNPGRFGSIALGIFNGGGYHAKEMNENKTVEGRLTIRPLPDVVPGLQVSYYGSFGKGNTVAAPDYKINSAYVSYECKKAVLTGQYYTGSGNEAGTVIDDNGESLDMDGFSVFGEYKIFKKYSLFGRFDSITQNKPDGDSTYERSILGLAYHFAKKCKFIIDYDTNINAQSGDKKQEVMEAGFEIGF